jgi:hypothetical protein
VRHSQHTDQFMSGYHAGFSICSGSGGSGGESRENIINDLCNLLDSNRGKATALALLLGYPGLDQAAHTLCGR